MDSWIGAWPVITAGAPGEPEWTRVAWGAGQRFDIDPRGIDKDLRHGAAVHMHFLELAPARTEIRDLASGRIVRRA